ncbi:uncharacterized protein LOC108904829 [Anoplophora glabripennis]|uniref:uncharacterized protein LOC108904829 n=1 Tax=Anoplophora glabripennis TaxID=217634 RepID=UPI000873749A|nr:uncharacterized protein LOC108904829 [Anoplophora glabripennis]
MDCNMDIKKYIKTALEDQNFRTYKITLVGSGEKSDGYASDITFATVLATTEEDVEKTIEVVVKSSRRDFLQTNRNAYEREAYFYKIILPAFARFQKKNNIKHRFNSVPKCYKTVSDESMEVIVMENLRKNGYYLYNRKKPLDIHHLRCVLREYGKFHAISFALKTKSKVDFENLVNNFDDVTLDFFTESFKNSINRCLKRTCDIVKSMGYTKLYEMCNEILQKGADVTMIDILKTVEPESAILHGDCWNNNFLYKYEDTDRKIPSKVAILDWQISKLHSPVLDLSYFIYSTCSEEQLRHFDELLDTYYSSFSVFLKDLGCDPEKLFPFCTLRRHWKKYSLHGVLLTTSFLHVTICDKEEVPEFNDVEDLGAAIMNVNITDEAEYRRRLVAVISHYYNYNK